MATLNHAHKSIVKMGFQNPQDRDKTVELYEPNWNCEYRYRIASLIAGADIRVYLELAAMDRSGMLCGPRQDRLPSFVLVHSYEPDGVEKLVRQLLLLLDASFVAARASWHLPASYKPAAQESVRRCRPTRLSSLRREPM